MKKVSILIAIISLMITACKSTQQLSSTPNDDVYYTSSKSHKPSVSSQSGNFDSPQVMTSPDSSSTIKSGSTTWADDYNDYAYSSRIKRFNSSGTQKSYFDDTYTNTSNYDTTIYINQDPAVNVYVGAGNSWDNWYGPSISFGFGWGCGAYGWGYDPWYWGWGYPYYSWPYWGGYGYGYGYWDGYWNGYWDGYYGYPPYYDYSYNNYYYGPRTALTSDGGTRVDRNQRTSIPQNAQTVRNDRTVTPEKNSRTTQSINNSRSVPAVQTSANRLPSNQEKYRFAKPSSNRQAPAQRSSTAQAQRQQGNPSPKYIRPEVSNQSQRAVQTQSYASPAYRQPKSSQEYINPRSQNPGISRTPGNTSSSRTNTAPARSNEQRRYSAPGNTSRTFENPSRSSGNSSKSYTPASTPSRSSERSYSPPSRSSGSGSYSAPARSSGGGSYSAPSRSGGGGSAPSSGGGGGRHR